MAASVKTAGLVLAGGQSRRMGQDKALLRVQGDAGDTLLQLMQQRLLQAGCEPVLISGAAVGGLPDRLLDAGPLAGIDAALTALQRRDDINQLLIVPVDMPALSMSALQTLMAAGDGVQAIHFAEAPLPLLLPHSAAARAAMQTVLASTASRSVRALAAAIGVRTVLPTDEQKHTLHNLNTPDDWRQWQRQLQSANATQEQS